MLPADPLDDAGPGRVLPRLLGLEVVVVLAIAVGISATRSVLSFLVALQAPEPLSAQTAVLNGSRSPGHPWFDLAYQLTYCVALSLPVLLVVVLLARSGETASAVGWRLDRWPRDGALGLALAGLVGGIGLAAYLVSYANGGSLTVVPEDLPAVWWRIPILVLSSIANACLEEFVLTGFLLHRMRQLGSGDRTAAVVTAVVRGAYHLYQGVAGALGNAAMGLLFARLFQRYGRLVPLVVAHASIDIVAFVGYVLLAGHVSWLPT